jgi:hypothetical protein
MVKTIVLGLVAIGLLASPALAQKYVPEAGSGNLVQGPGGAPVTADTPPYVGQRSGEAYNYDRPATTGQAVRHPKKKIRHIKPQNQ